jgi:hypothetical protein
MFAIRADRRFAAIKTNPWTNLLPYDVDWRTLG